MHKNLSIRFLLIPLTILIALSGFFGYIEFNKKSTNRQIGMLASAPLTSMAFHLEYSTLHLQYTLDRYKDALLTGKQLPIEDLLKKYENLKKYEALLYVAIFEDPNKVEDYIEIIDRLSYIRTDMETISGALIGRKTFNQNLYDSIIHHINSIVQRSHDIGINIETLHQKDLKHFLNNVSKDEKDRTLLSIFIVIAAFALILILVDAVYHFKNNAERAQAAEKTNALFAAALQSTRVGVLIRDMRKEDTPVVFINDSFTRMTGYKLADIHGHNKDFLFGWNTDQSSIATYNRAMNLHETATIDFMLYRQDGTPFWGEAYLSPVLNSNKQLAYYVILFNDITVFRKTQEDLIYAKSVAEQASAVKTNFLAMMSHEIRTPINGILGVVKLLQETLLNKEQQHLLSIANTSSLALNGIINDILDYAKMEAGKIEIIQEPFSLAELIKSVVDLSSTLISDKNINLSVSIPENIPMIYNADVGRLRQVLLNLMSNAIKFTDSGSVKLIVRPLMPQDVEKKPGQLLRFEVIDSGIGISPENQEKLFQEFTQVERSFKRRFGGTGLGLAICKRLITAMNGEVGVESQIGKGSKFWFMLPMQESNEQELKANAHKFTNSITEYKPTSQAEKILVVEDNEANRIIVTTYLKKAGLIVDQATNGLEAIDMARKTKYSLILMDVSMPEMDGMEATCQIRTLDPYNSRVPIIALTAHVMEGDKDLCLTAGMNDYLNKPIDYANLLRILTRWLKRNITVSKKQIKSSSEEKTNKQALNNSTNNTPPIFEASILQQMRDNLTPEAVEAVTNSFLKESVQRIKGFEQIDDISTIEITAHTLKSCSANCGLTKFSHLMKDIESSCKNKNIETTKTLLKEVKPIFEEACIALEQGRKSIIKS